VVLATNVAETSLTVPGIRYVIDPGEARISRYSFRTKVQRLPIERISQASANQRRGRCGRMEAGVCIRLYSEQDFNARPEFTEPEIQRTNLAAVILQMLHLGLGEVQHFPFINPPDARLVRDGYKLLQELGAATGQGRLTPVGRRMSRLPVDPRLARMVLAASERGCLAEILVICSALSVQDPRERPADKQQQSDQQHARFRHERSDFMAWLNLWQYYEEQRQALSQNQLRKLCQREFLSFMRLREWRDVHYQMTLACRQLKLSVPAALSADPDYESIHRALLAGLLSNLGQQHEGPEYLGCRNRKLQIFPGSSQFRRKPKWFVAGEIVETSKVYARQVAAINPAWVLDINPDLLKYHYYQPRWQARSGRAVAYERVTLYGLAVADKRPVHYGPIAPLESRELLIREALLAGRCRQQPRFLRHNLGLVAEVEELESRTRRRDILVEDQVLFDFYAQRLPQDIYTINRLQSWLKKNRDMDAQLRMPRSLLLTREVGSEVEAQFPHALQWQDISYRLSYHFEPGHAEDGVSVTVPVALLNRVPRHLFDWLVPGLLREKCIQLVRGLPKSLRKHLVPAPEHVDRALAELCPGDVPLLEALAGQLSRLSGHLVTRDDLAAVPLDDYYRMNVRVVDAQGSLLAQGRQLDTLVARFKGDRRQAAGAAGGKSLEKSGLTRWDFGALPAEWRFRQAGVEILAYPALVDKGDSVAIELRDYPADALQASRLGVLRLLRLHAREPVKYLRKQLLRGNECNLSLAASQLKRETLVEDLIDAALTQVMELAASLPHDQPGFQQRLQSGRSELLPRAMELEILLRNTLNMLGELRHKLTDLSGGQWTESRDDIERQLSYLFCAGFLRDTPYDWLRQYPRYMKALLNRLQRLAGQLERDRKHSGLLQALWQPLGETLKQRPGLCLACPEALQYRWMLEEFRVSLFAQALGTRLAVSEKRIREQWQAVAQWLQANPH
jgi:ATP-dependent helicase HrpA